MLTHFLRTAVPGLALLLVLGCGTQQSQPDSGNGTPESQAAVNVYCPIMEEKIDADSDITTTQWNGKTVAFCCPQCLPDWEKLSEQEKQEALDKAEKLAKDAGANK